ncbi:hypothetical protein SAMN05421821_10186 [Mucilaginibacter lappiensis]|uniref:Uncharacterized protein n=1 Tax=Mucilaginibacter lappiensis TaxID=354630 RepID=A0ABR6PG56_9SPHI|nr:hypothetical protein [Mucilaginibacter lappiensis]MBB6108000.1 hypothetical protein [Mucilaginibacter lappiensis]SIP89972.1 hypothetical protein SAMN05421821_10186 [Mucilaginibacter lappiensis]
MRNVIYATNTTLDGHCDHTQFYHFVVHPIVEGEGRQLFDGINQQEKLQVKSVKSATGLTIKPTDKN